MLNQVKQQSVMHEISWDYVKKVTGGLTHVVDFSMAKDLPPIPEWRCNPYFCGWIKDK